MTNTLWTLARQHRFWAAGLLAMLVATAAVAAPVYQVVDLGSLSGKGDSKPVAMNAQGKVVGSTVRRGHLLPVLFRASKPLNLIDKTGVDAIGGSANAVNSAGDIAGELFFSSGQSKPFVYRQGTMEVVEAPGYDYTAAAVGLSDLGHLLVTGYVKFDFISSIRQPDGTWAKLKRWNNGSIAVGNAIDRQGGVVVGYAIGTSPWQAIVWRNNKPQAVPGTEGVPSVATAVNDRGDIAGYREYTWENHSLNCAFLVRDGVLTDLTGPGTSSHATGMDNLGRVIGTMQLARDDHSQPFLFQDGQTMMLNDLVDPAQQGQWTILNAYAINDAGEIAAEGRSTITGITRALKLVPVTAR